MLTLTPALAIVLTSTLSPILYFPALILTLTSTLAETHTPTLLWAQLGAGGDSFFQGQRFFQLWLQQRGADNRASIAFSTPCPCLRWSLLPQTCASRPWRRSVVGTVCTGVTRGRHGPCPP